MKQKACTRCLVKKALKDFYRHPRAADGRHSHCKKCMGETIKQHYLENPAKQMLRRARARAAKKGFEFTITLANLLPLPTHCPVFGLKLTSGNGEPTAYSLDRIDNHKGYVPGNVVVMSYLANRLKNDGTAAQHEQIAAWMRRNEVE